jgi:hypothetical protein
MSRAPLVGLLLVAGRVKGVPQISFDVQPFGTVTANDERADVCGPMMPNGRKRMVPFKLVVQAPFQTVGFADVDRRIIAGPCGLAKDVDAFDREIVDRADGG